MSIRPLLLASAAVLTLAACHRDAGEPASTAAPPPPPAVEAPAPAPPAVAARAPAAPHLSAAERRSKLREEKDGEAQMERSPEYEGASSAATALPSGRDDAASPAAGDTPAQASPPSPPSAQPPG